MQIKIFEKRPRGRDKSRSAPLDMNAALAFINQIKVASTEVREKFITAYEAIQETSTSTEAARRFGYATERPFAKMLNREFFGVCYNLLQHPQMIHLINNQLIEPAMNPEIAMNPPQQTTLEPRVTPSPNSELPVKIPYRGIKRRSSEIELDMDSPFAKRQRIEIPIATHLKDLGLFSHSESSEVLINKGSLGNTVSAFNKV